MSFSHIVILQLAILVVILESDLGLKKIGWFRVARPVIVGIAIVPAFFTSVPTGGHDLALQGLGILAGLILGLISVSPAVVRVGFDPAYRGWWARRRGNPPKPAAISRAGIAYAAIWGGMSVARLVFAYTSKHDFSHGLGRFLVDNHLSADALTNALTFLALAMELFRSLGLFARARTAFRRAEAGVPSTTLSPAAR